MTDRRTFLKGLFATIAASPTVGFIARVPVVGRPVRAFISWVNKPLLNSGAWDSRYATYDEAKEASDRITNEIIGRLRDR